MQVFLCGEKFFFYNCGILHPDNGATFRKIYIMDVIIQSLGFKAGEELESYIQEKLDKLSPGDHIIRANVIMFLGPDKATPNTYCEIRLEIPGNDLFVKEQSPEFEQSVDAAVNRLQGMLRKAKEKQLDQWQGKTNS